MGQRQLEHHLYHFVVSEHDDDDNDDEDDGDVDFSKTLTKKQHHFHQIVLTPTLLDPRTTNPTAS